MNWNLLEIQPKFRKENMYIFLQQVLYIEFYFCSPVDFLVDQHFRDYHDIKENKIIGKKRRNFKSLSM